MSTAPSGTPAAGSRTDAPPAGGMAAGLAAAGVRRIFGMPGGGPNLDMIGAAAEHRIAFTLARGETAACVMAGVFGLLTGTPGVAVVTRGPGLTSAVNGLAQATLDRAPLLLVSDTVPADRRSRIGHQLLDQVGVAAPVTRWNGTLGSADPAGVAAAACALATGPRAGAVHLDFDPSVPGDAAPAAPGPASLDEAALERAVTTAGGRRRPVVVLGSGAARHAAALRAVLDGAGVPVLTTYQGLGTIDSTGPDAAGLYTNGSPEQALLAGADLVVGVGLDGVEPMPGEWAWEAPVVLLDDAGFGPDTNTEFYGAPELVTGPPAESLAALLAATAPGWEPGTGAHRRRELRAALEAGPRGDGLHPVDLTRAVLDHLGPVQVSVDAGAHMLAVLPLWDAARPHGVLISNGLATMGYALPAAIGAALARPGERVVCMVGDGGLGMTLAELETLARLDLPVTVVVFDDAALSLIELKQRGGQGGAGAVRFSPVDFAAVAAAMGIPSAVAGDVAGVTAALGGAGDGPFLLDARVDPAGYAHVMRVSRG
ncbi:thiamine pyrophosphate-binding protein [Pseudonocardia sp. N23]|uniref:thiamine pyrophosphate-binding protein n=1 Tax=Pseudonocardia sp. N23 TaxID=1987376 RepID=UPI000BFC7746|nr:thiamine pyrophosphate-dependent enzyme [Pseudonocardia sp. N23]GAY10529.1 similar to acetolactate synthase large subunit [Pseudonocardia sp. N23]